MRKSLDAAYDELNDADWSKLRRLSGLPDEARPDVAEVISFLRTKPSLQNPRELAFLRRRAEAPHRARAARLHGPRCVAARGG
jgi:hypothetical protein